MPWNNYQGFRIYAKTVKYKNVIALNILFNRNVENSNFYFDHSYHFVCDEKYIAGHCDYGTRITAAVQRENIFGVQFHPEKSQNNGLKLFRSFFNSI